MPMNQAEGKIHFIVTSVCFSKDLYDRPLQIILAIVYILNKTERTRVYLPALQSV